MGDLKADSVDPKTARPYGDHGSAEDAIRYALDVEGEDPETFLRCWREGRLDEWPEFYVWLRNLEIPRHPKPSQEAVERVRKYLFELSKMRMTDDSIHGLHMGDEREAELRASDLEALLASFSGDRG